MNRYTADLCFSWKKVYIWTDCLLLERAIQLAIKIVVLTWECSCGIVLHSGGSIWNVRFSLDASAVMWFELEHPRLLWFPTKGEAKHYCMFLMSRDVYITFSAGSFCYVAGILPSWQVMQINAFSGAGNLIKRLEFTNLDSVEITHWKIFFFSDRAVTKA